MNKYSLVIVENVNTRGVQSLHVSVKAHNLRDVYRALCRKYGRLHRCGLNGYANDVVRVWVGSLSIYTPMRTKR